MDLKSISNLLVVAYLYGLFDKANSQCTFNTTFASTTWHDSTRGDLVFGTTTMSGLTITFVASTVTQTISGWQCSDSSDDTYLVIRTSNTFNLLLGSTYKQVYAYMCMQLTKVTDVSFYYYQQNIQQLDVAGERIKISETGTLNRTQVCDTSVSVPPSEFHVLVKSGSESSAAIACPNAFLFTADYYVIATDGTTSCNGTATTDSWDICSNTTEMTFDYTTCTTEVAYSAGGKLWCVASISDRGYTFVSVYNQDSSIVSTTRQFSCLATDGTYTSVAPNNCTATQTPTSFPTAPDQTTALGQRLVITSVTTSCATSTSSSSSSDLSTGVIVAIVISVLFFMFFCTIATVISIIAIVYMFYTASVFLILFCELSGYNDSKSEPVYTIIEVPEEDTKQLPPLEKVTVTSPKDVLMSNGKMFPNVHKPTDTVNTNNISTPKRKKV